MLRISFLILVLAISTVLAQTEEKPKAYLFDEFGNISKREIKTRTEKLRKILHENAWKDKPLGTYLVFYYGEKQKSSQNLEEFVRDTLFDNCHDCLGYDPRITFVRGGKLKEQKVQFWIIPTGAEPPKL